jgi:hypothetical protein
MKQDEINAVKKAAEKMRKQESAQGEIIEMAIQGHAGTRDAIRWAMQQEREVCAKLLESRKTGANELIDSVRDMEAKAIRARGQA